MNAPVSRLTCVIGCLAATLLAGCASDSKPAATGSSPISGAQSAASPANAAVAKLLKNLTRAQVLELLGPPARTKPIGSDDAKGEIWSYVFPTTPDVRMVVVGSQDLPAINPLTGVMTTRSEPVYQNQNVDIVDTLHLLVVGDRLVEWRIVREETKKFQ